MKVREKWLGLGLSALMVMSLAVTGCDMGNGSDDDGDSGNGKITYDFNGTVFEDSALGIFDYDNLIMNDLGTTDLMEAIDVDLENQEIMMDFSTSKDATGAYAWNGMTLALDTDSYNTLDLSSYGALTYKAKSGSAADGNNVIEKVGFALGSEYEIYIDSRTTMTTDYQDFIVPIPNSAVLTDVSSLFYFTESAATPDKVYFDDVKFVAKSDLTIAGAGWGGSLNTYSGAISTDITVVNGSTYDLNENNPFWINYQSTDAAGTWANDNESNVFAVNGSLAGYFTWASDDESIATVDEYGVVTGVADGTANITATLGSTVFTFAATVSTPVDFTDGVIYDDALQNSFSIGMAADGGNPTVTEASTASFIEGSNSLCVDMSTVPGSWGGIFIQYEPGVDASGFTNIVFSINTAGLEASSVDYLEVKGEDTAGAGVVFNIFTLTPSATSGDWDTYTIPVADFTGVDFSIFKALGFWHPKAGDTFVNGTFYLDDIHFE